MELVLTFRPLYWICTVLIGLFNIHINGYLVQKEISKRRGGIAKFTSKYMRIFSIGTLWSGFIAALFVALPVFPGFCYLDLSGKAIVFGFQTQCMGWYQLSRLHYCFSNEKIHNRNGYPLSVFIILFAFGPLSLIDWTTVLLIKYPLPTRCGFRNNFVAFREYADYSASESGLVSIWFFGQIIVSWSWEITTLLLYGFKIWKIGKIYKSKQEQIWKNVLFMLDRIAILTIFYFFNYLISTLILLLGGLGDDDELYLVLSSLANTLSNMSLSVSVYLMMEHNTAEYTIFLRVLRRSYLEYLCFCCYFHKMVDRQIDILLRGRESKERIGSRSDLEPKANKEEKRMTVTNTLHIESARIAYGVKDNRISVPTMTIILEHDDIGETCTHKTIDEHSL